VETQFEQQPPERYGNVYRTKFIKGGQVINVKPTLMTDEDKQRYERKHMSSEDVRSIMQSTPSERVMESMETQTEPIPTRTSMETQTEAVPFGQRFATDAEIGRRERAQMRKEDRVAREVRSAQFPPPE
jgi:hypothetical protein